MSNAEQIYRVAENHAQTVQVCIDRLHELGANEQLKRLTGRLQKLAVRATPGDDDIRTTPGADDKGTMAARRQQARPQNLKGGQADRLCSQSRRIRGRLATKPTGGRS